MRGAYLYVVQPDDMPIFKVGVASDLFARAKAMQGQSPHRILFVRVLMVASKGVALAYERHIHSWLQPHASHGEWFTDIDAIQALLDEVAPAVDVTSEIEQMSEATARQRRPQSLEDLEFRLAVCDAESRGINPVSLFGFSARKGVPCANWRTKYAAALSAVAPKDAA